MSGDWCRSFVEEKIANIKINLGLKRAVVAFSGGVDSGVTAKLAWEAFNPKQLKIFTINDGLRREGEPEQVVKTLKGVGIPVEIVQSQDEFFQALQGTLEGDRRREIYSEEFGKTCGRVARDFRSLFAFFGTNALDIIETRAGTQKQHNAWEAMGIDPLWRYGFREVEPLKDLFKEQIRELARFLGLPLEISERMPFPGPGLAIRMMDPVTPERVALVRIATKIVEENLLPLKPSQCLACLLSGFATGKREGRGFLGQIIAVRSVESNDSLVTATATRIPEEIKEKIVDQILSSLPQVARVVFDSTPKPPGRIEYI